MLMASASVAGAPEPKTDPPSPPTQGEKDAPEEETTPEYVLVEGQVTDHIGAGHSDVAVTVRRKTEDGSEGELIATTTTDQVGDFKVTTPEPVQGDIVVTLTKPMYTTIVRELHVGDSQWPAFLAEQFQGSLLVIGRVTDALTTKPVAGASVTLEASYNEWTATADEDGRFTIEGVSPGQGLLVVEAEGYGRELHPVEQLEDFGEIPVLLKPERIVHIEIVDDVGKPITGVTAECYDEPRDDFRTGVTDQEGSITLRGIHFDAAVLTVRLTHEDHVSSEDFDRELVTPEDKKESKHRLVMDRAGRIEGSVTEDGSGRPLSGARVMTGTRYSDFSPRDWADYQGRYTIRGVRTGNVTVTVHLSGYAPALAKVSM
jgi:hypothetical protein